MTISRDKRQADVAAREIAAKMGFLDEEAARRAPSLLIETPDAVKRELRSRIEETGMTYFIVRPTSEESHELLVKEVMSEFLH